MAVLKARIYASVYGTAAELGASTKILGYGERWWRTDPPTVTDTASPFYNKPDPAYRWKTGDNTKTWAQLSYDPIGSGGGSGSSPELDPKSVLANVSDDSAVGQPLLIVPDTANPDTPSLRDLLGVLTSEDYTALSEAIGSVSEDEATAGGLRGIVDKFMAIRETPTIGITGTITNGSDTVVLATPLDTRIAPWARVFITGGGTGVAQPAYINSIASNRLSFRLTSSMFNFVDGAGTPMLATASGSRTFDIKDPSASAFGINLAGIPKQNVYNGTYTWRSTPNALPTNTITGETTETRIVNGVEWYRSAQVNGGAWEQRTAAADLVLISRQVVAAVTPSAHHTWTSLPAAPTEFLGETNGRHQFRLCIPDDSYTQFMMGIDRLIVAGTNTSTMWIEFLDTADLQWKDLTTARVTVSLNTPIDSFKESALGTLTAAAKTAAASQNSRSVICRIMAATTGAATGSPQFTNVWTLLK